MNYIAKFMERIQLHYDDLILAGIVFIVAILTGLMANKIISYLFNKIPDDNKDSVRGVILNAFRGIPAVWISVMGLYSALHIFPLGEKALFFINNIALVAILISWTIMFSRVIVAIVRINVKKLEDVVAPSILYSIAQITCYSIGFLIIFQSLGISVAPLLTALGIGGITIALGLQDTIKNFIAGIHILLAKRIRPGQYIHLRSGEEGIITDINWRDTTLRSFDNKLIIIPNSEIYSTVITNFELPEPDVGVNVSVGVSYDSNLEHVERVAKEVARDLMDNTEFGVKGYDPLIRYTSFDDSNINFNVTMRGINVLYGGLVRHEFIKKLYERFQEEGIVISYPVRVLQMDDKAEEKIKSVD